MDDSELGGELTGRSPKRLKKDYETSESGVTPDIKESMCGGKWEDLPINCLVDVFRRLNLDDLTFAVPFVCKSWYETSLDPACWKTLDFRALDRWAGPKLTEKFKQTYLVEKFSFRGFLKFVIGRGQNLATKLVLPKSHFPLRDLIYVCKECPSLNILSSWEGELDSGTPIRGLILKMNEAILKFHCKL